MLNDDDPELNLEDKSIRDLAILSVVYQNLNQKSGKVENVSRNLHFSLQPYFCGVPAPQLPPRADRRHRQRGEGRSSWVAHG